MVQRERHSPHTPIAVFHHDRIANAPPYRCPERIAAAMSPELALSLHTSTLLPQPKARNYNRCESVIAACGPITSSQITNNTATTSSQNSVFLSIPVLLSWLAKRVHYSKTTATPIPSYRTCSSQYTHGTGKWATNPNRYLQSDTTSLAVDGHQHHTPDKRQ